VASAVELARQERQRIAQSTPVPEPEQPSTAVEIASLPQSPRGIAKAAREAGWHVGHWSSRGPRIGADGQPLDIRNAIGVRGRLHDVATFQAMWIQDVKPSGKKDLLAWTFDFAHLHTADGSTRVSPADLKKFIEAHPAPEVQHVE
jgi:hypothetical protein